jgi:hypothetical protein
MLCAFFAPCIAGSVSLSMSFTGDHMTDSQDRPKAESLPYDCGAEGMEKKDQVPFEEATEDRLQARNLESGERLRPHHPAGRRPLFRN